MIFFLETASVNYAFLTNKIKNTLSEMYFGLVSGFVLLWIYK